MKHNFSKVIIGTDCKGLNPPVCFGPYKTYEEADEILSAVAKSKQKELIESGIPAYLSSTVRGSIVVCELTQERAITKELYRYFVYEAIPAERSDFEPELAHTDDDIFTLLYELKKTILIIRHHYNCPYWENGYFVEYGKHPMDVRSIEEMKSYIVEMLDDIKRISNFQSFAMEYIGVDYTYYTDKFYGNKFWNEIENDTITNAILNRLDELISCEDDKTHYVLSLYDYNDFDFGFESLAQANEFIEEHDVVPYTLFEMKKDSGVWIEVRSE